MPKNLIKIFLTLVLVITVIVLFKYFHLRHYLSIQGFNEYSDQIIQFQIAKPYVFICGYFLIYIMTLTLCLPGTIVLDVIAGFLFGVYWGTLLVVFSYTIGIYLNFLVVHYLFHDFFLKRLKSFRVEIHGRNQRALFLSLTGLRLVMVIPFWVLNIVASVLKIRMKLYMYSVVLGVLPAAIIYAFVGVGAREIILSHEPITIQMLMNPKIWLPLTIFAMFTMAPSVLKQIKRYLKSKK